MAYFGDYSGCEYVTEVFKENRGIIVASSERKIKPTDSALEITRAVATPDEQLYIEWKVNKVTKKTDYKITVGDYSNKTTAPHVRLDLENFDRELLLEVKIQAFSYDKEKVAVTRTIRISKKFNAINTMNGKGYNIERRDMQVNLQSGSLSSSEDMQVNFQSGSLSSSEHKYVWNIQTELQQGEPLESSLCYSPRYYLEDKNTADPEVDYYGDLTVARSNIITAPVNKEAPPVVQASTYTKQEYSKAQLVQLHDQAVKFTKEEVEKWLDKNSRQLQQKLSKDENYWAIRGMATIKWLYRNKTEEYFKDTRKRGIEYTCTKDQNGDPKNCMNGQIRGLFFCANIHRNPVGDSYGKPPLISPYGHHRLLIPANYFLREGNLYFADFACTHHGGMHSVTLIHTKEGSAVDNFCETKMPKLYNNPDNPFLRVQDDKFLVSTGVWVWVFHTENIPYNTGKFHEIKAKDQIPHCSYSKESFDLVVQSDIPVLGSALGGRTKQKRKDCKNCNIMSSDMDALTTAYPKRDQTQELQEKMKVVNFGNLTGLVGPTSSVKLTPQSSQVWQFPVQYAPFYQCSLVQR